MPSSPSPTSVIASINESSHLCSQAPDARSTPNTNSDGVFLRPSKHIKDTFKTPSFKQVVIVQQSHKTRVASQIAQTPKNFILNGQVHYKTTKTIGTMRRPAKEENYDFKNLAINNHHTGRFSSVHGQIQADAINKDKLYQQTMKINDLKPENYQRHTKINDYKPKCYVSNFTENGMLVQNAHLHDDVAQSYIAPAVLGNSYMSKGKCARPRGKAEDNAFALHKDSSFAGCTGKGMEHPPKE